MHMKPKERKTGLSCGFKSPTAEDFAADFQPMETDIEFDDSRCSVLKLGYGAFSAV
jgi:hypothetical protein